MSHEHRTGAHHELENQRQLLESTLKKLDLTDLPQSTRQTLDLKFLTDGNHELPGTPEEASEELKNTWAIKAMSVWGKAEGVRLLENFLEDFPGWKREDFESCHKMILRAMKNHLTAHGIPLPGRANKSTAERLAIVATWEDMPETTIESSHDLKNSEPDFTEITEAIIPQDHKQQRKGNSQIPEFRIRGLSPVRSLNPLDRAPHRNPANGSTAHPDPRYSQSETGGIRGLIYQNEHLNWYHDLPPRESANTPIEGAVIKQFVAMWNKENNYTGQTYDILDGKIRIFTDLCELLQVRYSQLYALFPSILSGSAQAYFLEHMSRGMQFRDMYLQLKQQFDSDINRAQYHTDWSSITFQTVLSEPKNTGKTYLEVLQILLDRLQRCQRALGPAYKDEIHLVANTLRAVQGVQELKIALARPERSFNALSAQLKSTMKVEENTRSPGHFYTDRRYRSRDSSDRQSSRRNDHRSHSNSRANKGQAKCWICGKPDCRSTKHTPEEQERSKEQWKRWQKSRGEKSRGYQRFLADVEPSDSSESENSDLEDPEEGDDAFSDRESNGINSYTAYFLANESFRHRIENQVDNSGFIAPLEQIFKQYQLNSSNTWYGIIPDTGAATISTAGRSQTEALVQLHPDLRICESRKQSHVRFGAGKPILATDEITVPTPIGKVTFHIVPTDTPFLLCIKDMDELGVYLDNTRNELVKTQGKLTTRTPVIRRWGHPWLLLAQMPIAPARAWLTDGEIERPVEMTETELRRVHRRFGHPSVEKLWSILNRADKWANRDAIEMINRFCHHCQIKGKAPQRFKFSLKGDIDFNYEIVVDIMYLDHKPVLHVIDASTGFQAATFIPDLTARRTWEALKRCWLDTYLGPPDVVTIDAGTNFASAEFKAEARLMGMTCHQIPIEAHWSIGKLERYHRPLRRAYEIMKAECEDASPEALLQGAVKAVNDTAGPNGLVPTLLVFGAMPRIGMNASPTPSQVQRADAVNKAMAELRKLIAKRKVNDALNARNGPSIEGLLPRSLKLGSEVLVFREKDKWTGPYRVLAVTDTAVTVDMVNGATEFRSTHVKPYERFIEHPNDDPMPLDPEAKTLEPFTYPEPPQPRRRGRPRKAKEAPNPHLGDCIQVETQFVAKRERLDYELAVKYRNEGKITTPGRPFEQSDWEEIESLLAAGVIIPIRQTDFPSAKLFGCRLVREVKGTNVAPYEKSRLVVQGHSDWEKRTLLTQSPTIMRCSQRLILAITPSLRARGMSLMLRDISQAYTQSATNLLRDVLLRIPQELENRYPTGTVFRVVKPLYGIAESGLHWFITYQKHHHERLNCVPSSYDPCLLITKNGTNFGLVGMQTDDTLNLGDPEFISNEDTELKRAGFKAKDAKIVETGTEATFNGCLIKMKEDSLVLLQKGQTDRLELVNLDSMSSEQQYVAQRARGAYIASICQPEAAFDYSVAAQAQEPTKDDVKKLNKRIEWQIANAARGLIYITLDLTQAQLYIFVDGSFANNKDLSSQIGFVVLYGTERSNDQENCFTVSGNIIHWQSVKCKRVTRSVLASEIYGMVSGFDAAWVLKYTLSTITERLNLPTTRMVMCTDSYSLYQCLVQLGTTAEKRLMIDLMALRQSYEEREIDEIRWIAGGDNPADAMTKGSPNRTLEELVSTNTTTIRMEGWVKRGNKERVRGTSSSSS